MGTTSPRNATASPPARPIAHQEAPGEAATDRSGAAGQHVSRADVDAWLDEFSNRRVKYTMAGQHHREAHARARAAGLARVHRADREVLSAVINRVSSYSRLVDRVSHADLAEATGLSRRAIQYGLKRLRDAGCIAYRPGVGRGIQSLVGIAPPLTEKAHYDAPLPVEKKAHEGAPLRRQKGAQRAGVYSTEKRTRHEKRAAAPCAARAGEASASVDAAAASASLTSTSNPSPAGSSFDREAAPSTPACEDDRQDVLGDPFVAFCADVGVGDQSPARRKVAEAWAESKDGVRDCWHRAKTRRGVSNPVGLFLTMVDSGEHRGPATAAAQRRRAEEAEQWQQYSSPDAILIEVDATPVETRERREEREREQQRRQREREQQQRRQREREASERAERRRRDEEYEQAAIERGRRRRAEREQARVRPDRREQLAPLDVEWASHAA